MSNPFRFEVTVLESDIDELKHVNNEVYLRWLIQAAGAHSLSLGYGMEKFLQMGAAFVVRRHEIDYLAPAFLGEVITIETWVGDSDGVRSIREYRVIRNGDQKLIMNAKTTWVYVDLKTGRPTRIPAEMIARYQAGNRA